MKGKSVPHYAAVEPQGKGVIVASEKPFAFTEVDGLPLEEPPAQDMEVENSGENQESSFIALLNSFRIFRFRII